MSVLIKGSIMPLMCEECPCYDCDDYSCKATGRGVIEYRYDGRPDNCPLVEIPTSRGRLIDVDAFVKKLKRLESSEEPYQRGMVKAFLDVISCEPTIIEAEVNEK